MSRYRITRDPVWRAIAAAWTLAIVLCVASAITLAVTK